MTVFVHRLGRVAVPPLLLSRAYVGRLVQTVFRSEKKKRKADINVIYVDRSKIRQLNKDFLKTSGDTDVIAFPYEGNGGDIYICSTVAASNARRYKEPFSKELTRLVIHGTLHLLGYADWPKKERDRMWKKQEPLVEKCWTIFSADFPYFGRVI